MILSTSFIKFKGPLHISKSIYNRDTPLESGENEQKKLKEELGYIKQGNPKNRSEKQQNTIDNIENFYNSRQDVVKMFNDYASNISRNIYENASKIANSPRTN